LVGSCQNGLKALFICAANGVPGTGCTDQTDAFDSYCTRL
jgi:hypothetical protein